ncbi:MAG TPA: hypothetical protein VFB62_07955 [Polyangiaceae bacterium]|nr:hypothetical protein [Polyangiaceae bacterium]
MTLRTALLVAMLLALSAVARADVPITEEARREFSAGVGLLEDSNGPRYREAYEAFHRAYADSPSPKMLSNIGLCAMMLERDGEAIEVYERYLREVPDVDPRERDKIRRDLNTLRAGAARLSITIEPSEATVIDTRTPASGAPVVNRYDVKGGALETSIRAGNHRIEVQAPEREPHSWSFALEPGGRHAHKVALRAKGAGATVPSPVTSPSPAPVPPPSPDSPSRGLSAGTIAVIAITGALVVGAVVTGSLALKYQRDYQSFESGGDRKDAEKVRNTGEALNITTDVLIGAAVAGAAAMTVLLILDLTGDKGTGSAGPVIRF